MPLTSKYPGKGEAKANKLDVETTHSDDGRSLASFWLDYDPADPCSLYLLTLTLDNSSAVRSYSVYDERGLRIPNPDTLKHPKRI